MTGRFEPVDNRLPKRPYPWGEEEPDETLAYTDLAESTLPCGLFPSGASPSGAEEMNSSIYEWSRSRYENLPYNPDDGREKLERGRGASTTLKGLGFDDRRVCVRAYNNPFDRDY